MQISFNRWRLELIFIFDVYLIADYARFSSCRLFRVLYLCADEFYITTNRVLNLNHFHFPTRTIYVTKWAVARPLLIAMEAYFHSERVLKSQGDIFLNLDYVFCLETQRWGYTFIHKILRLKLRRQRLFSTVEGAQYCGYFSVLWMETESNLNIISKVLDIFHNGDGIPPYYWTFPTVPYDIPPQH